MKKWRIFFILTLLGTICQITPVPVRAAAGLELYGTFEAMGVIVTLGAGDDPNSNAAAQVEYRVSGSGAYQPGFPLSRVAAGRFVGQPVLAGAGHDLRRAGQPDRPRRRAVEWNQSQRQRRHAGGDRYSHSRPYLLRQPGRQRDDLHPGSSLRPCHRRQPGPGRPGDSPAGRRVLPGRDQPAALGDSRRADRLAQLSRRGGDPRRRRSGRVHLGSIGRRSLPGQRQCRLASPGHGQWPAPVSVPEPGGPAKPELGYSRLLRQWRSSVCPVGRRCQSQRRLHAGLALQ